MSADTLHPGPSFRQLLRHPLSCGSAVSAMMARAELVEGGLSVDFAMHGRLADVVLATGQTEEWRDELWQSTCFEVFVRVPGRSEYIEFNVATSRYWAAYFFTDYRQGMQRHDVAAPFIDYVQEDDGSFAMIVDLNNGQLGAMSSGALLVGLSAIIEQTNGEKSYWALAHAPGKPDFHHARSFDWKIP